MFFKVVSGENQADLWFRVSLGCLATSDPSAGEGVRAETVRQVSRVKVEQRWPVELRDAVDEAAAHKGVNRTEFTIDLLAREVLGMSGEEIPKGPRKPTAPKAANPIPTVTELHRDESGECLHPRGERVVLPYMTYCGLCKERLS